VAFQNRAIADDYALSDNIADHGPGRLDLNLLLRLYIRQNLAMNEDRCCAEFSFDRGLLADGYIGLGDDFALDFAFDGRRSIKV